jgi:hypothetical protein
MSARDAALRRRVGLWCRGTAWAGVLGCCRINKPNPLLDCALVNGPPGPYKKFSHTHTHGLLDCYRSNKSESTCAMTTAQPEL